MQEQISSNPPTQQVTPQENPSINSGQGGKSKKGLLLLLFLFTALFFGGLGAVGGKMLLCEEAESKKEKESEVVKKEAGKDLLEYTSENFKMKFKYPSKWGEVDEEVLVESDIKNVSISFSNNPYLFIKGVSSNFDPEGIGDACPIFSYFKGWDKTDDNLCEQYGEEFSYISTMPYYFECSEGSVGKGSISYYYGPTTHCASYIGFSKLVDINTSAEEFSGIRIILQISHSEVKDLVRKAEDTRNLQDENLLDDNKTAYLKVWNSIKSDLENDDTKGDYITKMQLKEFDTFTRSIEFVE